MLKLIQYLIFGHSHKWVIIKQGTACCRGKDIGTWYDLQCEHCGNVKSKWNL